MQLQVTTGFALERPSFSCASFDFWQVLEASSDSHLAFLEMVDLQASHSAESVVPRETFADVRPRGCLFLSHPFATSLHGA